MTRGRLCYAAATALALTICLGAGKAEASDDLHLSIDWGKLAKLLTDGSAMIPRESVRSSTMTPSEMRWFGASPHLSLVARDWGGAQILIGNLMVTDQLRLSRSCRMIVSRVRMADGRVAPFLQAGLGQWRIDPELMPAMPRDVELAGQLGAGFELALGEHAAIAIETDYTVLYREQREPRMVQGPHSWVSFLAARALF